MMRAPTLEHKAPTDIPEPVVVPPQAGLMVTVPVEAKDCAPASDTPVEFVVDVPEI